MLRILTAVCIAVLLFVVGWSQMILLRPAYEYSPPLTVVPTDPTCDDVYADRESSLDPSIENIISELENIPEEDVLDFALENFSPIEKGQTLHSILRKSVSDQEITALSNALKPYIRPKDLALGDFFRSNIVNHNGVNIIEYFVIRKLDPTRVPILYHVKRKNLSTEDATFSLTLKKPNITEELDIIELKVKGSLYQTFSTIPFGNELMQRLMEILTWELRLPEEVNQGDEIELLVQKKFTLGEFIAYGKIEVLHYRQKHRQFFASYFSSKDGKIKGFFDRNGRSLEKEFAVSPVIETTATSNQKWRIHPIRKIRIRHNGVDYRGDGNDFFSIADGEIIEKRYDQNVGNMLRIKHKYGVHSEYFHAHSFAPGLEVGDVIKRGQKIGIIGRTGRLCTGPHLHMGLYRMQGEKRKFIEMSSLRKILKSAPALAPQYTKEFLARIDSLTSLMDKQRQKIASSSL